MRVTGGGSWAQAIEILPAQHKERTEDARLGYPKHILEEIIIHDTPQKILLHLFYFSYQSIYVY